VKYLDFWYLSRRQKASSVATNQVESLLKLLGFNIQNSLRED